MKLRSIAAALALFAPLAASAAAPAIQQHVLANGLTLVQAFAKKYFVNLQTVTLGDPSKLDPALGKSL